MKANTMLIVPFLPLAFLLLGNHPASPSPWGPYDPSRYSCGEVGSCPSCKVGTQNGHKAPAGSGLLGEAHDDCITSGSCDENHCSCTTGCGGETFEPTANDRRVVLALIDRAVTGEVEVVREAYSKFPDLVSLHEGRRMLQVQGCRDDVIIASIPLTPEQFALLTGD